MRRRSVSAAATPTTARIAQIAAPMRHGTSDAALAGTTTGAVTTIRVGCGAGVGICVGSGPTVVVAAC